MAAENGVPLPVQSLTVLGSTGSIGVNTLDVVARHPSLKIYALTAGSNDGLMLEQCLAFSPQVAVMADAAAAERLQVALADAGCQTRVEQGEDALAAVAAAESVDTVMAAIVGAAGTLPALAAARAGKKVLLANKEALVMTGELFMRAARESGATVLPIDSEHNAIFQCLPPNGQTEPGCDLRSQGVRRVVLTASGGPFLHADPQTLASVTPAQACNHPNWSMGRKISVDSATMMNKGLEYIEACYLFDLQPSQVDVVIHPQSIVHSMVEYHDGSVLAQMGSPDMRVPIAHALAWPQRVDSGASFLDLASSPDLQFYQPDLERFPCLALGIEAARQGGYMPATLNAANEVAVAAFLDGRLRFTDIATVVSETLARITCTEPLSLAMIQQVDKEARAVATGLVSKHA
ncbi:1-deoxy-D-xylulose-5-phosphate reductoisomerase [Pseudohongiella nitratireducens]|uniref:1-deoxy-D-xylulose-5-phosphate reductoisomerase n=1 Tax=Pseudohongiella nitratireducens TaxID=1768907 RepID=UPI0030ED0E2E|tara:strand:+ start:6285 stop:7502 length:1218 start_codon:yes stop_codon:yes gene_type:complete